MDEVFELWEREQDGREAPATAAMIDGQSAKADQRGSGLDPQGYDAGKKVTGRKRHVLVDTLGLLLSVVIHSNSVQDRDGAHDVLRQARRRFPFIETIFADAGYQGPKMAKTVAATGAWRIVIVKRSDAHRFVVLPKRWIVTACTMLPSWALSGRCSSSAEVAVGGHVSPR